MIVRGKEFDDIYDLVAVRVIVDTEADCYGVLGIVHGRWTPMPGRFKDYIASPKFNFYRSLHTTVIGPSGKPVEVQIRTHEMHRMAEYGVAAHWRYKQNPNATKGSKGNEFEVNFTSASSEMDWLRQLIDWQKIPRIRQTSWILCASRSLATRFMYSPLRVMCRPYRLRPPRLTLLSQCTLRLVTAPLAQRLMVAWCRLTLSWKPVTP